ncbi:hypothetical protein HELRODRAFT_177018 [Helobdella robusta]|uniref:Cilia-and flagella-associated protein 96 n=1 Tax=Helobdella robusta TaxID=6412 RepID=T1FB54_HELRO|nr:hypothetical protein HELRODRAFT_177018 [Helobdella robusta]ESN98539.1 hypothetical protein HELRODRAFT_177018 [Helobdella robusta]
MANDNNNFYQKNDMNRLGIFKELGYISIGDEYKDNRALNFNQAAGKGKQMVVQGAKTKASTQDGYFDKHFSRIMEGEAYSNPAKITARAQLAAAKLGQAATSSATSSRAAASATVAATTATVVEEKQTGPKKRPFIPSSGEKKPSGSGSYYGCLSEPVEAFSSLLKPKDKEKDAKLSKFGTFRTNLAPRPYFDENPYKNEQETSNQSRRQLNIMTSSNSNSSSSTSQHGRQKDGGGTANNGEAILKPFKPSSPAKLGSEDSEGEKRKGAKKKSAKTFFPNPGPKKDFNLIYS